MSCGSPCGPHHLLMASLFISDLHLDPDYPATTQQFLTFLAALPADTDALYILGDLFEIWIGDDYIDPAYEPVIRGLQQATRERLPIHLLHGNRDFLLGDRFMQMTGCQLREDPQPLDLYGRPALLMHGDLLCSDDREYQAFRRMVRDPEWQTAILARPVEERLAMARDARSLSSELTRDKAEAIMDINQSTVETFLKQHQVGLLIHGHTHRPGIHEMTVDGRNVQRAVLGDWHQQGSCLRVTENSLVLESI